MNETDTLEEGTEVPVAQESTEAIDEEAVSASRDTFDYSAHKVKVNNGKIQNYIRYLGADIQEGEVSYKWLAENLSSMKVNEDNILTQANIIPGGNVACIPGTPISAVPIFKKVFGEDVKIWSEQSSTIVHQKIPDDPSVIKFLYPPTSVNAREILEFTDKNVTFTLRRCGVGYASPGTSTAKRFPPDKKIAIFVDNALNLQFELFSKEHIAMSRTNTTPHMVLFPDNTIVFNMTCNSRGRYISDELEEVMTKLLQHAQAWFNLTPEQQQEKLDEMKNMEVLVALRNIFEGSLQNVHQNFTSVTQSLERQKAQLVSYQHQYEQLRQQLEDAETFVDKKVDSMLESIRTIRKTAYVKEITVDPNAVLTVETTKVPIFISEDDAEYVAARFSYSDRARLIDEYGPFEAARVGGPYYIQINLQTKTIRFYPTEKALLFTGLWTGSVHPHVSGSGEACWGNAVEPIAELQSQHEYPFLVDFLLDYLQSVNVRDPAGREYYKWPVLTGDPEAEDS
ncbi:MAG: hypothetical protein GTN99_02855 [Candidatus Dadabacteria bacterium]|nr:hypothetical protein [Candidatus Dadabacteria bacterium]